MVKTGSIPDWRTRIAHAFTRGGEKIKKIFLTKKKEDDAGLMAVEHLQGANT